MTQEDDHRNPSGETPEEPVNGGSPTSDAPGPDPWAAPGRESSVSGPQEPQRPSFAPADGASAGVPGFAAPGSGAPSGRPGQAGYGQPGHGYTDPQAGRGYGPPGYGPPQPGHPQDPARGFAAPGNGGQAYGPPGHGPPGQGHWQAGQGRQGYGYGGGHQAPPPVPKPGVVALRPMTLGDILNGAFSLIRRNPKTMVGLSMIVLAVSSIVSSIGFGGYMSDYGTFLDQVMNDPMSVDPNDPMPFSAWSIIAVYGGGLISYAGTVFLTGLLTTTVGMAVLGRRLSPGETWTAFRERIGPVIGLALLQLLIGMGLSMVVMGATIGGVVMGVAVSFAGSEGLGIAVVVISLLVGLLGGGALALWILIRIYFAMPIVVLERVGVGAALARSWRLTQGSWWRVFGIVLLSFVLIFFVSSLLSTPFSIVSIVPSFVGPGELWAAVASGAVMYVGNVLVYSVTTPFTVGVTTLLYVDLRMRREGLDLRLHTAALSGHDVGPEIYLPEPRA
ncbi:glycerophosphoryl diester phosphodiesterase membrane domain-containing protein [Nocardiopsis sp. N85]|uniref:glycerophosphoryl diester phosphodiesterase membrane domain-containing protein n=1 Tax=Nocardiopsis sp. N85 TaxID=3029400 RepID=UPI00237F4EE7|nr:glycerophosphoryl diester phosphodiesterase membrane domain-containing protein [Nocardiopsis sp. N85]MDE3721016.1 glycerophosphoryl diester phosphodiesterase membrane domain-containing protein [Nocardiopsis sp. N85]